jgi:hypothetical protein
MVFIAGIFKERPIGQSSKYMELSMVVILVAILLPFFLSGTLVLLNLDPLWFLFPATENAFLHSAFILVRLTNTSLATYGGWIPLATYFMTSIIQLQMFSQVGGCFRVWVDAKAGGFSRKLEGGNNNERSLLIKSASFNQVLVVHRQARIIILVANETHYFSLPILLFFGQSILVLSSYATIKIIPMPVYFGMPFLSVYIVCIIMSLFPSASNIFL